MAKTKDPYGRNTSTVYRRKCHKLKFGPNGSVCFRGCGVAIDVNLPATEANSPWYWTGEHDPPLSEGGDLVKDLVGGSHRKCNSRYGRQMQMAAQATNIERSREW
jgi:hypothetical protein